MAYTPVDILDYVIDNDKEADFMVAISMNKGGYSIGEISDQKIVIKDEEVILKSQMYKINQVIEDLDIIIAARAGKYISSFISRYVDTYQIHFLVHECMTEDKARYEEDITKRVVQYMILRTIKQLRLDSPKKVDDYISV